MAEHTKGLTDLQAATLLSIEQGHVHQLNCGTSAWRIQGASAPVVGRLISMKLAEWGRIEGKRIDCSITDAGQHALSAAIAKAEGK